jgi:DNA helicase-2/ATP-dependent DNA helicase PcrA
MTTPVTPLLNDKQYEASQYTEGPLLIIAGAGAGKTKTLTERIVTIIKNGTDPRNILAVTFTNKAAKEMRERVVKRLEEEHIIETVNPYHHTPLIRTFHSLAFLCFKNSQIELDYYDIRPFLIKATRSRSSSVPLRSLALIQNNTIHQKFALLSHEKKVTL